MRIVLDAMGSDTYPDPEIKAAAEAAGKFGEKVILVGNLGKDPEVRTLENGAKVANFTLATSETYKNREGQRVTTTEWHKIHHHTLND